MRFLKITCQFVSILILLMAVGCGEKGHDHHGHDHSSHDHGTNDKKKTTDKPAETIKVHYKLDFCVVTNDKLEGMENPVTLVYKGREIKLCCKGCVKEFNAKPDEFVKKIVAAEKAPKKDKTSRPTKK